MSDSDFELSDDGLEDEELEELPDEINFEDLEWNVTEESDDYRDYVFYGLHGLHPRYEVDDTQHESFFFNIMFPDHVFEDLAKFTNIRAHKDIDTVSENITPGARLSRWKDVTPDEMRKFVACLFLMGIIHKPTIESYWSKDTMTETPFFSTEKCLSRDRFQIILRFVRFSDYSQHDVSDPLHKISDFLEKTKHIIQNSYMPSEKVAIDEVLLLFKGRLFFRNFIPSKRSRYGIKIYALVDEFGYMWNFHVHTTASNLKVPQSLNSETDHLGFAGKVVVSLACPLFDMNYVIFCDNFFVSEKLAQFLIKNRTHLCGTTRFNRLPPVVREAFPNVGDNPKFFRKERMLFSCFTEKKQSGVKKIAILDTKGIACTTDRTIRKKGGGVVTAKRPLSLTEYNNYMGLVDETDAQLHPYDCTRKSMNWTTKVGIHLLQRLLLNAYALHKQHRPRTSFLKFSLSCIDYLFSSSGIGRRQGTVGGRPKHLEIALLVPEMHVPQKIPSTEKKANPSRRCRVCFAKGIRKETRLICASCSGNPPLCPHPCFNMWHLNSS